MTAMFLNSQNKKSAANFYVRVANNRASAKTASAIAMDRMSCERRHPLADVNPNKEKNIDKFEGYSKSEWDRGEDVAERTFAMLYRELENTKVKGSTMDVMVKCIRIANRIQRGDFVPLRDDKFLFDNYPQMHLSAWMLRKFKEDPEEHESELCDECDVDTVKINISSSGTSSSACSIEVSMPEISIA